MTGARLLWPAVALALLLVFNLMFTANFFQLRMQDGRLIGSLIDVLDHAAPIILTALGMTLVIATGGVDLSVGAIAAIAGTAAAVLISQHHLPMALAVAAAAGVALAGGLWNGLLVARLDVQPIVATLILMVSGRGLAQLLGAGQVVEVKNSAFDLIARGTMLGLPMPIMLAAAMLLLLAIMTRRTALGLFIESVGNNPVAAHYAGVNARLMKLLVYTISGVCAGIAGLVLASEIRAADANNAGMYLELDAILAVIIGGTALAGGRFLLVGSVIGALLIQTTTTMILTRGVAPERTLVVKALIVIFVCLLHSPKFRRVVMTPMRRRAQ